MSMGLLVGFVVAYPINWWLVANHLERGMITIRTVSTDAGTHGRTRQAAMSGMAHAEAYVSNFYGCGSGAVSAIAGNGAAVVPCIDCTCGGSASRKMQVSRCPFRKFHPAQIRIVRQNIIASLRAMFAILHALGMIVAGLPFRKRHPEITLHYTRFKFPVLAFKFPVPSQKFPVLLSREFRCKPLNIARMSASEPQSRARRIDKIPSDERRYRRSHEARFQEWT